MMEEQEIKISQEEFEEICRDCCDLSAEMANGLSPDYFWCDIYKKVRDRVGHIHASQYGETLNSASCQNHLKGLVERKWSEPFDVLGIARKYIEEVLERGRNYIE